MASTSASETTAPPQQLQQQQQQQQQPAAPHSQSKVKLSLDEISKLFSLPIAEAASILGVCTSVLKRICRDNGIARWPYRKFLAGKTFEDIKRDAEREKNKEPVDSSKKTKQKADATKAMPLNSVAMLYLSEDQNNSKSQSGVPTQSHILQQGVRFAQGVSPNNMLHLSQIRNIPTFMDEFKYGFPTRGLSSLSNKWWGSGNSDSSPLKSSAVKDESQESCELSNETSKCTMDDMADSGTEDSAATSVPSAVLCSLRRKALEDGRGLLKDGACNGCELHKLNKRQRLVLAQVFGSSLPDKWKDR
ncbi:Protein RKD5 [Ananas comosus]|uniref:Protein RKD5 n=2 Tax=Ananas comosus TaxID=4615 RepID=A0A199W625_ANACO|nr:Protein RKD5 [Ananas comosus]